MDLKVNPMVTNKIQTSQGDTLNSLGDKYHKIHDRLLQVDFFNQCYLPDLRVIDMIETQIHINSKSSK